jgi:hypothetical protein
MKNPTTFRRILTTAGLLLALGSGAGSPGLGQEEPEEKAEGTPIRNPYYETCKWRVWRDDPTPIPNVQTVVKEGKQKKAAMTTLSPTPVAQRIYPAGPPRDGRPIKWAALRAPSKKYAGVWDDVYASWSGLHGYVRSAWKATDGSEVTLRPKGLDHIMHFVEVRKLADLQRCGINFTHQSTTGMCHTITNGYDPKMTTTYEKVYFSDCLVTAPAHASYTEEWPDRTKDLVIAHVPTLFSSVGSSNSETMAITKLIIAGGYLPPETKRILKRSGLYPSALLYIWKASLPFDVPYDHELRHRIAYRALGRNDHFPGKYGHAGSERGNLSLEYHCYDEIAHLRNMAAMAADMSVTPPEAVFDDMKVEGGKTVYLLKKAALVLQEKDQDVTLTVSTGACYDLGKRPLTVRWKLLYGTRRTTCVPGKEPDTWKIRVPWDEALPEGRTAVALVANNGVHDGNPAIITVFRKKMDLPPTGGGYKGYGYTSPHANKRPVILGLQDQAVRPGRTVRIELRAVDPEGRPVRFYKRAGEPGKIEGNVYTCKVPRGKAGQEFTVTVIASDGTAGNSYAASRLTLAVSPRAHAHIDCKTLVGAAPFKFTASTRGSLPRRGAQFGWEFYAPGKTRKPADWKKLLHKARVTHTFEKPGLYEAALTVKSGKHTDRQTVHVWVTDGPPPAAGDGITVEGNGVEIRDKDDSPCAFDHTRFGTAAVGGAAVRRFHIFNRSEAKVTGTAGAVTIAGANAAEFRVSKPPAKHISPLGSTPFEIEFKPQGTGLRTAELTVRARGRTIRFAVAGTGEGK